MRVKRADHYRSITINKRFKKPIVQAFAGAMVAKKSLAKKLQQHAGFV